jgi:hypothetical protein
MDDLSVTLRSVSDLEMMVLMVRRPPSSRFSPQKVRETFTKVHILSTVETGITAGQSVMSPIVTGTHLCGETPTRSERRVLSKPLTCTFILRLPPQHSACTQEFRVLRPLRPALDGRRRATGARRCRALRLPSHARAASVRPSRKPRPRSARKRKSAAERACQRPTVGRGLCCPTRSRVTVPGLRQPESGLQEGRVPAPMRGVCPR